MPGTLMLLNPSYQGGRKMARRRRKMTAKQLKYFGPRRKRRAASSRRSTSSARKVVIVSSNPRRKRRHHRRRSTGLFGLNPRRARRVSRRRFKRNPTSMTTRRFRRNPINVQGAIMPAAIGAGGAIAVDYLYSVLLPNAPTLQGPVMTPLVRMGLAFLVGWGVEAVAGAKAGADAAAGGLVVAMYGLANNTLGAALMGGPAPAGVAGLGRYMGAGPRRFRRARLGAGPYSQTKFRMMRNGAAGGGSRLGYMGPAPTLGRYMSR
jgi:hypothetical protein